MHVLACEIWKDSRVGRVVKELGCSGDDILVNGQASVGNRLGSEFYLSLHDGGSSSETLLILDSIRKRASHESIARE
jgi:hypothetical protein